MLRYYLIGIPLFFFAVLYYNRNRLTESWTKAAIGILYAGYRLDTWFFEMVDMIHKLFLTSLLGFFPLYMQLPCGMVYAWLYLIIVLRTNPYIREDDDKLALLAQTEIILLLMAGYIFYFSPITAIGSYDDWLFSIILILLAVVFFCAILYLAWAVGSRWYRHYKESKDPTRQAEMEQAAEAERVKRNSLLAQRQEAFFARHKQKDVIFI